MKQRYTKREPVQSTCILSCEGMMGQGQLLNLSVPGCLLKTSMKLKVGQYVDLRLSFPTSATALQVKLAAVRWAKNGQAPLHDGNAPRRCIPISTHISTSEQLRTCTTT